MKLMRLFILIISFQFSSLFVYSQLGLEGEYYIDNIVSKISVRRDLVVLKDVNVGNNNYGKYKWTFKALEDGRLIWQFHGYATEKGVDTLELYVEDYTDIRERHQKKVNKKVNKLIPFYEIYKVSGLELIYIEKKQGKRGGKVQMSKKN